MACARLAKPTGVFCFRSHPVKVARVGSSMAIPIAECRPCICFSPGMCCPDDRAPWRAHCQFFYPFSMGTCTKGNLSRVDSVPYDGSRCREGMRSHMVRHVPEPFGCRLSVRWLKRIQYLGEDL